MRKFGLIGFPLSHSFSPAYFADKFNREGITDCSYETQALSSISKFPELMLKENYSGLNVTIPYKQEIIPFLSSLDKAASEIGAVNTIQIKQGKLTGYNTDAGGFEKTLLNLDSSFLKGSVVLGTGGSSKAILYTLRKLGIPAIQVSRTPLTTQLSYAELTRSILNSHPLIINCTPSGMFPDMETCPEIPYDLLDKKNFLYDLVYNPEETRFLALGKLQGTGTMNGLPMLHNQADLAWEVWNS